MRLEVMTQVRCKQGKDAPEERRCSYLRKNGKCRTFQCTRCKRSYPWCQGASDDHPNWCDHCTVAKP